jgi:acetyl esterase/lipase
MEASPRRGPATVEYTEGRRRETSYESCHLPHTLDMTPPLDRRQLLLAGTLAATVPMSSPASPLAESEGREIELWPGGVPGVENVSARESVEELARDGAVRDRVVWHVTRPLITVFEPRATPRGITFLIVPGGGYRRVVIDREGFDTAAWLTAQGFGAAVLRYRLPGDRWPAGPDAPVHDGQRALRWLRANAGAMGARLGIIGFSAGGHLAARVISEPRLVHPRRDALDDLAALPDLAVLMYPVILTTGAAAHGGSVQQLILSGVAPTDGALARYEPTSQVSAATPPTMLIHAADDQTVPLENSLRMHATLRAAGVASELHVFESGGHGFGLRGIAGKSVASWPMLVQNWAQARAPG